MCKVQGSVFGVWGLAFGEGCPRSAGAPFLMVESAPVSDSQKSLDASRSIHKTPTPLPLSSGMVTMQVSRGQKRTGLSLSQTIKGVANTAAERGRTNSNVSKTFTRRMPEHKARTWPRLAYCVPSCFRAVHQMPPPVLGRHAVSRSGSPPLLLTG